LSRGQILALTAFPKQVLITLDNEVGIFYRRKFDLGWRGMGDVIHTSGDYATLEVVHAGQVYSVSFFTIILNGEPSDPREFIKGFEFLK